MMELIATPNPIPTYPMVGSTCNIVSMVEALFTAGMKSNTYHNQYVVLNNDTNNADRGMILYCLPLRSYNIVSFFLSLLLESSSLVAVVVVVMVRCFPIFVCVWILSFSSFDDKNENENDDEDHEEYDRKDNTF